MPKGSIIFSSRAPIAYIALAEIKNMSKFEQVLAVVIKNNDRVLAI